MHYWENLTSGQSFEKGDITLTKQDILEFAGQFDPQPYHLDSDAAKTSIFGGLCASGWQICVLATRLLTEIFEDNSIALMGMQNVLSLRWKMPVFEQDRLTAYVTITQRQADSNRVGQGRISCDIKINNQKKQTVLKFSSTLLVAHAPATK